MDFPMKVPKKVALYSYGVLTSKYSTYSIGDDFLSIGVNKNGNYYVGSTVSNTKFETNNWSKSELGSMFATSGVNIHSCGDIFQTYFKL